MPLNKLEPGKTLIATTDYEFKGEKREISVYYGNYVMPKVDGEFIHYPKEKYMDLLDRFIEFHSDYDIPTEDEMEEACRIVSSAVSKNIKKTRKKGTTSVKVKPNLEDFFGVDEKKEEPEGESVLFDETVNEKEEVKEEPISERKLDPRKEFKDDGRVNHSKQQTRPQTDIKEEKIEVSKELYERIMDAEKAAEVEEAKDKEIAKLNNRIAELSNKNEKKDILLKKMKFEKNKDFNEKLDDKLYSILIVACEIVSITVIVFNLIEIFK